jgi:hypothetical protein
VTINYDDSVERAATRAGRAVRSYTWEDLPDAADAAAGAKHPLNVLHAHGYIHQPESIVLTDGTYQSVEGHDDMQFLLAQLFLSHQACIFGSKMDEVWLYQFFTRLGHRRARHVLLTPASEARDLQTRLAIDDGQHMVIQTFPDRDWVWLDRAAEAFLLPSAEPLEPLPAAAVPTPPVVDDFVPPVLAAVDGTGDLDSSLLPYLVEMDPSKRLTLEDLAAKSTAVVVGRPGSGKTQMLRRIASAVPDSDRAVYVRLAQTRSLVGAPEVFLLGWLRDARQAGSEEPITPDLLNSNRFHFLLDGLDEVPTAAQDALARRIAAVASAFPQHRFTVTSRRVAAVATLANEGWELLELATTSRWRDNYLQSHGMTINELLREAPVLSQLGDLLSLPFFLHTVIELRSDSQLPATGDAFSLARALIDRALAAPELQEIDPAVRPWLADVALTMQLTGRPELEIDQVGAVPLPAGVDLGPTEQVIGRLTDRSLLEHHDNGVRFVHRLLADALVAERLIALGPDSPGLLDLVVPSVAGESGLRDEWLPAMTFAGAADERWRGALAERDPLAAARIVPATADIEERRTAALTLWRHYVKRDVWLSSRASRQALLNDGEAIGRLLAPGDLPDVIDHVLAGVHSSSPRTRSNVMEVLASAQLDAELLTIVRVTLSGDSEEVVRRQAAALARDRGLNEVFPLVRQRALHAEHLEAQLMVSVGAELATDEELLDFALDVESSGASRHWSAEDAVRRRLGPGKALRVLRARYEHGDEASLFGGRALRDLMADLPEDEESAEDLGFIAALGGEMSAVARVLRMHPAAALKGLEAGYQQGSRERWRVPHLILELVDEEFDPSTLSNERLRREVAQLIELRRRPTPATVEAVATPASAAPEPEDDEAEAEVSASWPTLSELLQSTASSADDQLRRMALQLQSQVADLGDDEREELGRRLDSWWPDAGLASGVTATGPGRSRVTWEVHAILVYGGALRQQLTKERWMEIATIPLSHTGREEWLREQYEEAAASEVAERLSDEGTMAWARLMEAIPGRLPQRVVDAFAGTAKQDDGGARELLERLSEEEQLAAIQTLATAGSSLGPAAAQFLALNGDLDAQRACLHRLIADLGTTKSIHSHELRWMDGISDQSLLDQLFVALVTSYTHPMTAHNDFNDTMEPIHRAIERIGGAAAVAGYDELLAREPEPFDGVSFEVLQRDAIAQKMLSDAGNVQLQAVLEHLGLPCIKPPEV